MKKISLTLLILVGVLCCTAQAQLKLPPASTTQFIIQDLGVHQVSIIYQRPSIKGRVVFGDLVPFNQIWRTGANNATNITFQSEVMIEGQKLAEGTYALFTIPNKNEWTIIFNKNAKQWGSYKYDENDDVLRIKVKPVAIKDKIETFTISFDDVKDQSTKVSLAWENTKVAFNISVDQSKEIIANIEEAMNGEKKPYFQAAQYYFNNNLDIQKAASWIVEADKGNTQAAHIKYWKSLILKKSGDQAGAIKAAEEGIAMAKKDNNTEYVTLNTKALQAAKK
ncbi:DUF2911 domain-containing protein [Sphingobacterium sp. HJSM2_6]|uniref:DUF2911 domain-containing protein n=1 Tax=Sphingobacterium sp. HJSM2_6 TaxID=3366264 RepID=UPI003BED5FAD